MNPPRLPIRARSRPVCQVCDFVLQQLACRRPLRAASTFTAPSSVRRHAAKPPATCVSLPRIPVRSSTTGAHVREPEPEAAYSSERAAESVMALKEEMAKVETQIEAIYSSPKVESEEVILDALDGLESIAQSAISIRSRRPLPAGINVRQSSAGAILSLNGDEKLNGKAAVAKQNNKSATADGLPSPAYISRLAESLLKHPNVFISPNILTVYIYLQRLLARPRAIPEILYLYANKPVPILGSSPPEFTKPSPKGAKQAVPGELAEEALTAAIEAKDINLALDVIETTYCTPAWRRHRLLTKLGIPGAMAALLPFGLYMIAQELSVYSNFMEPWLYKTYAFMGMLTYVGCTGTLGFVALTTHNDHFDRVVWRPGIPLLDRYVRENERAALDRIAGAWGFKETWRRGDEEGEEWEGLRQWILLKDMILDKSDLMEGMNPPKV